MLRIPIALAALALVAGCSNACTDTPVSSSPSPDGAFRAVLFQRDCGGAKAARSTQVSLTQDGDRLTGGGDVFRAQDNDGAARKGSWGGPWAEVEWTGPRQLVIRYAAKSRIFEKEHAVQGVEITYQPVTR
ncbi:hypothetical protein RXV95_05325 [Novosphingobium sp. ZN18A2]|uniref:hypothetical protein n=1 Tax=Novosphingobium sp. ZN18A2 TaxID=3079861 RepID=UPI0030CF93F2